MSAKFKQRWIGALRQERLEEEEFVKDDAWQLDVISVLLEKNPPRSMRSIRERVRALRQERQSKFVREIPCSAFERILFKVTDAIIECILKSVVFMVVVVAYIASAILRPFLNW